MVVVVEVDAVIAVVDAVVAGYFAIVVVAVVVVVDVVVVVVDVVGGVETKTFSLQLLLLSFPNSTRELATVTL